MQRKSAPTSERAQVHEFCPSGTEGGQNPAVGMHEALLWIHGRKETNGSPVDTLKTLKGSKWFLRWDPMDFVHREPGARRCQATTGP